MHTGEGRGHRARAWRLRLVVAAVLALLPVTSMTTARAHSDLVSSSPAASSVVGMATDRVVLVFVSDLLPGTSAVVVRDPEGRDVTTAGSGSIAETVEAGLELQVAGRHDVAYRVVGEDGHVISGSFSFTVATGEDSFAAAAAVPRDTSTTPAPGTVMWGLLVVLLGVAVFVRLLGHRSRHGTADADATPQPAVAPTTLDSS